MLPLFLAALAQHNYPNPRDFAFPVLEKEAVVKAEM